MRPPCIATRAPTAEDTARTWVGNQQHKKAPEAGARLPNRPASKANPQATLEGEVR